MTRVRCNLHSTRVRKRGESAKKKRRMGCQQEGAATESEQRRGGDRTKKGLVFGRLHGVIRRLHRPTRRVHHHCSSAMEESRSGRKVSVTGTHFYSSSVEGGGGTGQAENRRRGHIALGSVQKFADGPQASGADT